MEYPLNFGLLRRRLKVVDSSGMKGSITGWSSLSNVDTEGDAVGECQ